MSWVFTIPDIPTDKKVVVPISMSAAYHQGDKLMALLDRIREKCPQAVIVLADSLDRHNLITDLEGDKKRAHKEACAKGDALLNDKRNFFKDLRVSRWDEWLKHQDYREDKQQIEDLYQKNEIYRKNFEKTIANLKKRTPFDQSIKLLKEECAIYLIWDKMFDYVIYPSQISHALKKTAALFKLKIKYCTGDFTEVIDKAFAPVLNGGFFHAPSSNMRLPAICKLVYSNVESVICDKQVNQKYKTILALQILDLFFTNGLKIEQEDLNLLISYENPSVPTKVVTQP